MRVCLTVQGEQPISRATSAMPSGGPSRPASLGWAKLWANDGSDPWAALAQGLAQGAGANARKIKHSELSLGGASVSGNAGLFLFSIFAIRNGTCFE